MMRVRFAVAVLATAVGGGVGVAGCNVLLDASDYAVGPNDASASTTGADGNAADGGTHPGDGSPASADAGTIGDPCVTNQDCAKGTCGSNSWCTTACTTNAACGSNGGGGLNYCVPTGTGSAGTCAPACTTSDDCLVYNPSNPSTVCAPISATNATMVCSLPQQTTGDDGGDDDGGTGGGSGSVGDPCSFNSDCASNRCFDATWCTASCTSVSDTSCGYASSEAQNYCAHGSAGGGLQCFTGCGTTSDCYLLSGTVCEPMGNVSVCNVTAGAIGDPCEQGAGSVYTACAASDAGAVTCNDNGFCSKSCTTNGQCGTNTSGSANYCLQMGGSGPTFCVPGCKQDGDCADFADTFCSPVSGSTTEFACATTGGLDGDPCEYDSDCVGEFSLCGDQYMCTESCNGPSDTTTCGSNSQGTVNACAYDQLTDEYDCFAPCTTDAQCTPYSNASEEPSSCTLISGSYVCANSDATTLSVTIPLKRHRRARRH